MPRLAEKLLVMLWAAAGQGASCPALWRANADVGETSSCCSCTQRTRSMHAFVEIWLCENIARPANSFCPALWRANADVGETTSCCSCTQCIRSMHASVEKGLCEDEAYDKARPAASVQQCADIGKTSCPMLLCVCIEQHHAFFIL